MEHRWFSQSQPQTLQMGVMLLYLLSAFYVIDALLFGGVGLVLLIFVAGQVGGAFGIANESKTGYRVALTFAVLPLAFLVFLMIARHVLAFSVITVITQVALVALLAHSQSREYARIWFH